MNVLDQVKTLRIRKVWHNAYFWSRCLGDNPVKAALWASRIAFVVWKNG